MPDQRPSIRIACASGFSGDRTDGAAPVVAELAAGGGGTLIFETLAERTLALAQLSRDADPERGYEPLLDDLVSPVLGDCLAHDISIVSNFGAANPPAAARRIAAIASEQNLPAPRIAIVTGDALNNPEQREMLHAQVGIDVAPEAIVSATAYLGAREIAEALTQGAQVVVAGRVADPALTVGPAMAHFGWSWNDWPRLGRATMAGHMLECGTQVTGGYFAVPGLKDVPDLDRTGFPIVTLDADGGFEIGKPAGTGGRVDCAIAKEQLLYEVHDPAAYLTPDVIADISQARIEQVGVDRVRVAGISGHARPDTLKVNICYRGGWLAEAEISYAGHQAESRARLAGEIVQRRIGAALKLRIDLVGSLSVFGDDAGRMAASHHASEARDIRLRVAAAHEDRHVAERVLR